MTAATGGGGGAGRGAFSHGTDAGEHLVALVVRRDGTYDYQFAAGADDALVAKLLRQVAEQIEIGATVPNSGIA
ncbi:hypothetical protein [Mycolicibacterium canariasense]|uniref:hypothetical protein n=1 Tax=Mycolicibacterium canariasense TaxID=228230 RepID=UPI0032D58C48